MLPERQAPLALAVRREPPEQSALLALDLQVQQVSPVPPEQMVLSVPLVLAQRVQQVSQARQVPMVLLVLLVLQAPVRQVLPALMVQQAP